MYISEKIYIHRLDMVYMIYTMLNIDDVYMHIPAVTSAT